MPEKTYQSNHIAQKLGVRHDDFCRRLLKEFSELVSVNISQSQSGVGRPQRILILEKQHLFQLQRLFPRNEMANDLFLKLMEELFHNPKQEMAIPRTYSQALLEAGRIAAELEVAQTQLDHAHTKLQIQAPKAAAFDAFLNSEGYYSMDDGPKIVGEGRNTLYQYFFKWGWVYKKNKHWTPYQFAVDSGWLVVRIGTWHNEKDGKDYSYPIILMTPKGVNLIRKKLGPDMGD